jgi:acylphosphatase
MRRRFRAYGVVQGVGFRDFVRRQARCLDLSGYVRNLPDGSVELEVEGPDAAVAALCAAVADGPRGAVVTRVGEEIPGSEPLPAPFAIRW